ncbi:hypothetical protein B6U71_00445 [Euryarchaeota archaeon ex4484_178]|nr:MAG: hypothetical protein B6U71_00445 [Euryarchaeota archaeon ex4484_178]
MNVQEALASEFFANSIGPGDLIVVNVKVHKQTQSNLILLKAMANINDMRGLVITLEKPHHYLTYLLGIQGISQRNLTYVDLAYSKTKRVHFPLKLNKNNAPFIGGFINSERVSLSDFEFIMIDNISTVKMYLTKTSVLDFIEYLADESKKRNIALILPMDTEREKEVLNILKKRYPKEVNFEEVLKNVNQ